MKTLLMCLMFVFSLSALAEECASTVSSLRTLVGNKGLAVDWSERSGENPVQLKLRDSKEGILVIASDKKGLLMKLTTEICRKGDNYVANVEKVVWGPAAPKAIQGREVSTVKIKLPYQSVMKISVSLMTLEFSANK